jgi:lysozyme
VGVGWNLTDVGLPDDIIDELLRRGVDEAERRCRALVPRWEEIDDARQRVLLNMAFNLGDRLRQFKRLLAAIGEGDYEAAATEMLRSAWATQVKGRATRLAAMMRKGE